MLIIASLLSILLLMFHFTDDILREGGMAVRGASNLIAVPILFAWLYGTLVLAERRSGYIIMLVGSLIGLGMPVLHMVLAKTVVPNEIARARGDYFFVWTLLALGVIGLFSFILSVRGLWSRRGGKPGSPGKAG
jgi:ABC-type enterochelin transport system permease subunit